MKHSMERRKIVLFHPHYQAGEYNTKQLQPLDLLSISAFPLQEGYKVVILDASVTDDYRTRIREECEDALCFCTTSIIGYQAYHSFKIAREVKEIFPSLPIIAGGWFPSVETEKILKQGGADIVVVGQGERTFMELLEALRTGSSLRDVDGIAYKEDEEIITTPPREIEDLNKIPPMPYHLINFEDYFASDPYERARHFLYVATGNDFSSKQIRALNYFSSYGCPDNCTFCSSPAVIGRKWAALEAERMVDEIDHLVKKHHFNLLSFVDANWGISEKRVIDFCEGLMKRDIHIYWAATAEAHSINRYDKAVLDLMARSGCIMIYSGAETGHPATMKRIRKKIRAGDILKSCEACSEHGIFQEISYIVGYPGESEESIQASIEEACEIARLWPQVELAIVLYLPIPGTPFHSEAVELGYQEIETLEDWSNHQHYRTELYSSLGSGEGKYVRKSMPEIYSSISVKQLKSIRRCQHHYFWWGCERLKIPKELNIFEKFLNKASRFRLKHKLLGFPIEYKLFHILCRILSALKRMKIRLVF